MRLFKLSIFTLVLSALLIFASSASAQQTLTPDQAKAIHNPLSNLREVIFQLDVLPDVGPESKTDWVGTIQPVRQAGWPQCFRINCSLIWKTPLPY